MVRISRSFSLFVVTLPVDSTNRVTNPIFEWETSLNGSNRIVDGVVRRAADQMELNHCQRDRQFRAPTQMFVTKARLTHGLRKGTEKRLVSH